jgi:hypothetical protein
MSFFRPASDAKSADTFKFTAMNIWNYYIEKRRAGYSVVGAKQYMKTAQGDEVSVPVIINPSELAFEYEKIYMYVGPSHIGEAISLFYNQTRDPSLADSFTQFTATLRAILTKEFPPPVTKYDVQCMLTFVGDTQVTFMFPSNSDFKKALQILTTQKIAPVVPIASAASATEEATTSENSAAANSLSTKQASPSPGKSKG